MFIEGRVAGQGGPRKQYNLLGVNIPHVYIINHGYEETPAGPS